MNQRILSPIIVSVLTLSLFNTACLPQTVSPIPAQSAPPTRIVSGIFIDWTHTFNDLAELCNYAEVIVIGTVDRVSTTVPFVPSKWSGGYTNWDIRVEKLLKGKNTSRLVVSGTGDQQEAANFMDVAFAHGDRYLLFLREVEPGVYSDFGPAGKYPIWNGKVYSINHFVIMDPNNTSFPGIDFNGVDPDTLVRQITAITANVQLLFTQNHGTPSDVIRYDAGTPIDIDVTLSSGQHAGKVTYTIDKSKLPAGLDVSIFPSEFVAKANTLYNARLIISTSPELPPNGYVIPVVYDFSGAGSGQRSVTLYINPYVPPRQ